jgi:integrase
MPKRLTTIAVENTRPRAMSYEVKDASSPLRLAVRPSGAKSWILRYRRPPPDGRTAKLTHERFVPLAEARKWATSAMAELAQGRDPGVLKATARAAEKQAAAERAADTVDHWSKNFIERYAKKQTRRNSWRQTEHVFHNIVLPKWSGRGIHDIRRRDVIDLIEGAVEDRGPIMANRAFAHVRHFFGWLCERDIITASPCVGVKPPAKEHARDRILNDGEIKRLVAACDAIGAPAGPAIKLALLTGQRIGEITGMKRSEIKGDLWSLPPERVKSGRAHDVPLSRQALAIIDDMPVIAGSEDFVFTGSATRRLGNLSRAKAAIDAHMKPAQPWVVHDLRRTCASGLQRLGTPLPVVEKTLNHSSGSFRGVAGVYARHDYAVERRVALQKWADHVDAIVRGEPVGKVVSLRSRP